MGGGGGGEGGQDGGFKFLKRKSKGCIRPSYEPFRFLNWLKMKGNVQQSSLSNKSLLCYRKAASKSRPITVSVQYFNCFECEI